MSTDLFDEFLHLPEGWNSYGAARISPTAVASARRVREWLEAHPDLSPYHIAPHPAGDVGFEAIRPARTAEWIVVCCADGTFEWWSGREGDDDEEGLTFDEVLVRLEGARPLTAPNPGAAGP